MQEAGGGHDPPQRAGHGHAGTLPPRHRRQCRNTLSPGTPITPATALAPLPQHPGPLSKEVTKCHPRALLGSVPSPRRAPRWGCRPLRSSRCSAASSPLVHLPTPKQVTTEVGPKLDNLPCPGCESGGRCRRFSSSGALPTPPRRQRASTLTAPRASSYVKDALTAGIHCPFISWLLSSPLQRGAESYSTPLSKQRRVTQVGAVAGKGRNPPPTPISPLLAIGSTLTLRRWRRAAPSRNAIEASRLPCEKDGKTPPRPIH